MDHDLTEKGLVVGGPSLTLVGSLAPQLRQTPALLQFLGLLPAGAGELEATIAAAVAENPVLERRPGGPCSTCGQYCWAEVCTTCGRSPLPESTAGVDDWRTDLVAMAMTLLPRRLDRVLVSVVAALDDRGFLPDPPEVEHDDLQVVLDALRQVGPPGLGAAGPLDCVRVQAAELSRRGVVPELVVELTRRWLSYVADERYDEIATGIGCSSTEVRQAVGCLRDHVRPFVALPASPTAAALVDVVFVLDQDVGSLRPRVVDAHGLGLRRTDDLVGLDTESRSWLEPHRRAARAFIAAVDARASMVARVCTVLADCQRELILSGPDHHAPILRVEVARLLEVHPATVGRAVTGKVARCPDGRLLPLEECFGTGPTQRRLVAEAHRSSPGATDAELALELTRSGHAMARRTVAKYRRVVRLETGEAAFGTARH